ncbi:CCR4-NOT transcription complex subunit 6-like [Toxocara canis]|uniref:CCR4-NOT transcription complex subunit 6-like n=1 Tax=Toxocara canis TaxID=6265 RepID=A0A0B2VLP3_TOXCA|nr:CCR4-NOT transcription complex subunit 6-like [Toxocara canis]
MAANGPTNGRLSTPANTSNSNCDMPCGNMANGDSPPDYKPGGSAGLPVTKAENAEGRKQLLNGMHRMHRIMTEEEIAQGKQPRWTELEVHGRVKNVSPGLWQMTSLTALFLNGNALTRIPNEISQLVNLTMLDLSFNKLRSLPAELGDMISLCHLYLNSNLLRVLPYELGKLFRLQTLGLQGNPLSPELSKIYGEPNGQQKVLQFLLDHLAILHFSFLVSIIFENTSSMKIYRILGDRIFGFPHFLSCAQRNDCQLQIARCLQILIVAAGVPIRVLPNLAILDLLVAYCVTEEPFQFRLLSIVAYYERLVVGARGPI